MPNPRQKARHYSQSSQKSSKSIAPLPLHQGEVDVVEGLEQMALQELRQRFGKQLRIYPLDTAGVIRFSYLGDLKHLLRLQTALSVYLVLHFPIPRPRALLGDEHFRQLVSQINMVRALMPSDSYQLLYLSAAGSDSSVMTRLTMQLATELGLAVASHEGDLLLRLRPSRQKKEGWEVLIRLSPRPLVTRAWRLCNMEGALNATIAHAMARLTQPTQSDIFLNLACGSGTLLIERLACGSAKRLIGCDIEIEALACARKNLDAYGEAPVELYAWDARSLPLPAQSVDVLCADLPFGHLVGSHEENSSLYPAIMQEAARVAKQGGIFVLITHEVRLMDSILKSSKLWQVKRVEMVMQGGLHPRIFVLKRL